MSIVVAVLKDALARKDVQIADIAAEILRSKTDLLGQETRLVELRALRDELRSGFESFSDAVEAEVAASPWPSEASPSSSATAAVGKASKRRAAKRLRPPSSRTKKPASGRRKGAR